VRPSKSEGAGYCANSANRMVLRFNGVGVRLLDSPCFLGNVGRDISWRQSFVQQMNRDRTIVLQVHAGRLQPHRLVVPDST
jgi:hypothetical protein